MTGQLLTARDVAELLGVTPATVLRWTRQNQLPAVRLPSGAIRYREVELDEWLAVRAVGADTITSQDGRAALKTPPARPGPVRRA
jgi:excisionase family DNA binding protein